ncbi:MAG TPA: YbaK/EbsC family protein [Rubrobacteraceae bacterium]|jgi:prolyl-tRNA editing enzyme YbaK/EbsC (Cys-tRNA(Pro) deacylase)|nr:YbaK/EbsC family protein [Rubrobacteraceae bacterium]
MGLNSHSGVLKVREALEEQGCQPEVVELERTARSAAEAADALGVRVEQIVKSLVFRGTRTGSPVLVLAGGANRVDEDRVSDLVSEPVGMADAAYVRAKTGFSIGGVPPVGHAEQPVTLVDEDLLEERQVWAAAGHTHVVFGLEPVELVRITGGRVAEVK